MAIRVVVVVATTGAVVEEEEAEVVVVAEVEAATAAVVAGVGVATRRNTIISPTILPVQCQSLQLRQVVAIEAFIMTYACLFPCPRDL
jgi:hypothetical protein